MEVSRNLLTPGVTASTRSVRYPIEDLACRLDEIEEELANGARVELLREGRVVADVSPRGLSPEAEKLDPEMPDFMARMKEMWGNRTFGDSTKWIREDRDAGF